MTDKIRSSMELGPKLLRLLGIPVERCTRAYIIVEPGQPVIVSANYQAIDKGFDNIEVDEFKRYKFIEITNLSDEGKKFIIS